MGMTGRRRQAKRNRIRDQRTKGISQEAEDLLDRWELDPFHIEPADGSPLSVADIKRYLRREKGVVLDGDGESEEPQPPTGERAMELLDQDTEDVLEAVSDLEDPEVVVLAAHMEQADLARTEVLDALSQRAEALASELEEEEAEDAEANADAEDSPSESDSRSQGPEDEGEEADPSNDEESSEETEASEPETSAEEESGDDGETSPDEPPISSEHLERVPDFRGYIDEHGDDLDEATLQHIYEYERDHKARKGVFKPLLDVIQSRFPGLIEELSIPEDVELPDSE